MSWQILISISVLTYSFAVIFQKIILKEEKIDAMAFSIFFQLLTGLMVGAFGFVTFGLNFPDIKPLIFNLLLMVIFYTTANIFLFKALQKIDASEFTIIFSSRALFTILASSLLIREGLNALQLVGTLLIIISVIMVTLKSKKFSLSRFEVFAIIAAMGFGFATTNDRVLLGHFELFPYVFLAFIIPALFTIPIYPKSAAKLLEFFKFPLITKMLALSVVYALSAIAFFMALQISKNSSQIASLNLTTVILTVIFSILILKEHKNILRKLLGSILAAGGVLLLK